ncbi:MAG: ARPP-1 family domain-containing protein [Chitinophagales bacterium]
MTKSTLILLLTLVGNTVFAQFNANDLYVVSQDVGKPLIYKHLQLFPVYANGSFQTANQHLGSYLSLQTALKESQVSISEIEVPASQQTTFDPFSDAMFVSQEITSYEEDLSINPVKSRLIENGNDDVDAGDSFSIFDDQILHPDARRNDNLLTSKLYITNHSQDTIFVMAGEVLKGGRQDRVIAQDMIIPPSGNKMELPVFCAEKDRWYYRSKSSKDFDQYFAVSSLKVRKAVSELSDQAAVWKAIEDLQLTNNVDSETKAYSDLMASMGFNKEQEEYMAYFTKSLEDKMSATKGQNNENEKIVGVIVATGGNIIGCDIFATHDLFVQQYEGLLHSYTTDAITYGQKPNTDKNRSVFGMNKKALKKYLEDTLNFSDDTIIAVTTNTENQNEGVGISSKTTDVKQVTSTTNFEQKVHFSSFE